MQDSSENSLLVSLLSSLEQEEAGKKLEDVDHDDAGRNSATGFNILIAAQIPVHISTMKERKVTQVSL